MIDANIILKLTLILTPLMSRRLHTLKVKGFFMLKNYEKHIKSRIL